MDFDIKIHKSENVPIFLACVVGYGHIMATDVVQKREKPIFHVTAPLKKYFLINQ